jgi:hypothetical protein
MNKKIQMFRDRDREEHELGHVLFVDPGLGGTGWAFFRMIRTLFPKTAPPFKPECSGVLKIHKGEYEGSWLQHSSCVIAAFRGLLSAYKPQTVVLESPALWSGNAISHASAISGKDGEPGDLFKLAYLLGGLGTAVADLTGNQPVLVMPYEWKGQLPKEVILERLDSWGIKAKDHEADAIGMGLAAQGRL